MPFEDLLMPREYGCKTCRLIGALEPALAAEVDVAMAKARYGNSLLARALATTAGEPVGKYSVKNHRDRKHRLPA